MYLIITPKDLVTLAYLARNSVAIAYERVKLRDVRHIIQDYVKQVGVVHP